ncbi:helix-turn-helix domain-containing protein [Moheibacter stercoris]|uniref:Transcriptional regulator with XRE-family HTH domain n=1 Tax=Moheibacter stercoris TaxID=1628251 RepID=A0ABV2LPQ7_9FLAO
MDSKDVLRIYMEKFSENLRKVRKEKFNSADELSKNTSFDSSNYSKYEKAHGNPTIETILKMASAFEIEPKELFDFDFDIKKYKIKD